MAKGSHRIEPVAEPGRGFGAAKPDVAAADEGVLAPETLEGWYALHQVWRVDRSSLRRLSAIERQEIAAAARLTWEASAAPGLAGLPDRSEDGDLSGGSGWSAVAELTGSVGDVLVMHFRPTLDAIGEVQCRVAETRLSDYLTPVTSFLSVTEAGLYHITAGVAAARVAAGGAPGDAEYRAEIAARSAVERRSAQVQRRLYPRLPADLPYVCFYPMSKRRAAGQNWYALSLAERSRLMHAHGQTGRRYAGRVQQVITGAIGLDAWEWGVTLFARDPLDIKRLVTDMRFDEVSAQYADFGAFYVGRLVDIDAWLARVFPREAGK
jgi:hydrogen peroxide-dependent heme synthase